MFGAAAVRKKKQKALDQANKGDEPLHPYIKPFGTRFDPSELPYFKYKKTLEDAKELSKNVSGAPVAPTQTAKKDPNKTGRPPRPRQDQRRKKLDKAETEEGIYRASGSANIILYVGLGMISIGLIITFVGLGDKGFRTLELKLIGPSLVGCGAFFAILRVLFCTVPSCCRACCKCCRKKPDDTEELIYGTDDPLSRTGYVAGNNTNMSANSCSDSRKIGSTNEVQKFARKRSGIVKTDRLEGANFEEDFQNKMLSLETDVREDCKNNVKDKSPGFVSGSATKPVSYDTYSTDTSSQFSVDIVDVAPTNREFGEVGQFMKNPSALYQKDDEIDGIVLNAMKLQVESEK